MTRNSLWISRTVVVTGLMCGIALAGCKRNEYAPPPPPKVTVAKPVVQNVTRFAEYTGTTRAVEAVDIRARVKGFLVSMEFKPGQNVEKDELLFVIDPQPFEVTLKAAEAELTANRAELALAKTEYQRTRQMYKRKATSEFNVVKTQAGFEKAKAAVLEAEANVHGAQLDLDYAHVKSPIAGRVDRHQVDIGNLVGASEATLLTRVVRYDPIYVYFYISERDLLGLQELTARRRKKQGVDYESRAPTPIEVGRANEEGYPHHGIIDFTASELDSETGTFEVRGVLPNSAEQDVGIVPGTFVRVRIPIDELDDSMLVTERAIGADQSGRYLLVVNDEGVVEHHSVEVGQVVSGMRVILSGIEPTDWVVVNGLQRARPGAKVDAEQTVAEAPEFARKPVAPPISETPMQEATEADPDSTDAPNSEAPVTPDAAPDDAADAASNAGPTGA
jgi:RND family efflux transporter MFP subunit